jgi:SAM-dependent methyltransferase
MAADRTLIQRIGHGIRHPDRLAARARRSWRNLLFRKAAADPIDFYRRVVDDDARRNPDRAVGSDSEKNWLAVGKLQFDYLLRHGVRPTDRVLDIGCGNLRLGWRLISYLEPGNYFGVEISPVILFAALRRLVEFRLQAQLPHLFLIEGTRFDFLPGRFFDFVQAHSVFTHLRLKEIGEVLAGAWRVMKPGARFDFTYAATDGKPSQTMGEDFRYPGTLLLEAARRQWFEATPMEDWEYVQAKIRAVKPAR